jgi:hypothetical protein
MSYGDGGFWFLQPVNNGYGALDYAGSPYGKVVKGRKIGRYTMLRQARAVSTSGQKKKDAATLRAFLDKLKKEATRADVAVSRANKALAAAQKVQAKAMRTRRLRKYKAATADVAKASERVSKAAAWSQTADRAVTQMKRNLSTARERELLKRPRAVGPVQNGWDIETGAGAGFEPVQPDPEFDEWTDEGEDWAPPGSVAPDHLTFDEPLALPAESFLEQYRTPIYWVAGGAALYAVAKILRRGAK